MAYILGAIWQSAEEYNRRFGDYAMYLESISSRLPPSSYAFATADWHYNFSDSRCPHDAWLEELCILEPVVGDRQQYRTIDIRLRLLGAYHDGKITLHYRNVYRYTLRLASRQADSQGGHGDWRDDEIRLAESGAVLHEIVFGDDGSMLIECADIVYEWLPVTTPEPKNGNAPGGGYGLAT